MELGAWWGAGLQGQGLDPGKRQRPEASEQGAALPSGPLGATGPEPGERYGQHWSRCCPAHRPPTPGPGWLDFTLLPQMFPDVSSHWTGGVDWGTPEGGFVSYPGVSTQALCPACLPPSGTPTPPQPPFLSPTSISKSPRLFIATSTNCVSLRLASAGPMPVVPTLLSWVDLLWWIWAESPGVCVGGAPGAYVLPGGGVLHLIQGGDGVRGISACSQIAPGCPGLLSGVCSEMMRTRSAPVLPSPSPAVPLAQGIRRLARFRKAGGSSPRDLPRAGQAWLWRHPAPQPLCVWGGGGAGACLSSFVPHLPSWL